RQSRQIYSLIPLAAREPLRYVDATTVILLAPVVFIAFAGQIGDRHLSVAHFMVRILGMQPLHLAKCALLPGSMQKSAPSPSEPDASLVAPDPLVYGRPAQETVMTP
ncbi:MAG: hypothetical protein RR761_12105, partial [Aeromonas sp.]|uniref:hypothetical protein n=1 Tax=Aeromonas sp. TaxID=647 RepID=UPI002FCC1C66